MKPEARPCICQCGQTFRRRKSLPLCKVGFNRACELMQRIPLLDEQNAEARRFNRVWSSEATVAAMIASDRQAA